MSQEYDPSNAARFIERIRTMTNEYVDLESQVKAMKGTLPVPIVAALRDAMNGTFDCGEWNDGDGEPYAAVYGRALAADLALLTMLTKWHAFISTAARLVKDGEQDDNGDTFDMPSDDAVESLHSLISQARALLNMPDRPDGDGENMGGPTK